MPSPSQPAAARCRLRRVAPGVAVLCALLSASPPALAGEWERSASLALGSIFSDNICLSDLDKKSETVGTVTPAVRISGQGGRASAELDASIEYNSLGESDLRCEFGQGGQLGNRQTWAPRGRFLGSFDAIDGWLRLEADALAAQNAINPFAPGDGDNLNGRGNTNITYQYGASAILERLLPDSLLLNARYRYLEQYNDFNLLGDSTQNQLSAYFGRDPRASRLALGVAGNYNEISFEESPQGPAFDNELSSVELRGNLQLSRSFSLDTRVGREDNVFLSNSGDVDGDFWDFGVRWSPNTRIEVTAGTGERFFGETPRFSASYRHKRSALRVEYAISVTFPQNVRVDDGNLFDDELLPPSVPGSPLPVDGTPTFIGQGAIKREDFRLQYRFQARRTSFSLRAGESDQTLFLTGGQARFRNIDGAATRRLGRRLSVDLAVGWSDNQGGGGATGFFLGDVERLRATLGVSRTLGNSTELVLRYSYTDQSSALVVNDFAENRFTISLRHDFR